MLAKREIAPRCDYPRWFVTAAAQWRKTLVVDRTIHPSLSKMADSVIAIAKANWSGYWTLVQ